MSEPPAVPLLVVEGPAAAVEDARGELASLGWSAVDGIAEVRVRDAASAGAAVLAALEGRPVLAWATADRDVVDRLCDDLRRLGRLDHRVGADPAGWLTGEQHELLAHLGAGASLGAAATALHLSRRSADRRLAAARAALGAASTSAALAAYRRRLARLPARLSAATVPGEEGDRPTG
ncbi:hypothetical protein E8D34_15650 [Nocardioides sp. GY 10113]|uniref:hypothetical protein n=1 Tax=Nocardioides sp. GY 10113 TaxID=2569761 RepID=UPI0010A92690|nr:hypothetical protein [Nocardioides sp. GY 10113]TIC83562.1 hypothetical protein E8D34_15650 [Nocardioides sp. GY 10113]